jgi:hypothetical protein
MSFIPKFLLKKIYVAGSLRALEEGRVAFDVFNCVGPGMMTRLNRILLNDIEFSPEQIILKIGDTLMKASDITENNPMLLPHNQVTTCLLENGQLIKGLYKITVDMMSREVGNIVVTLEDQYAC